MIKLCNLFVVFFVLGVGSALIAEDTVESPLSSQGLYQDVISEVKNPMVFNWRRSAYELDIGYIHVDEKNNFETEGGSLGITFPSKGGYLFRLVVRRIEILQTGSSKKIGRTPYKQPAGVTRYEILTGGALSLLEGRVASRFSPIIPDLEHV